MAITGTLFGLAKTKNEIDSVEIFKSMMLEVNASGAVVMDGRNIAAGSIYANQLHADSITANKIKAGEITTDHITTSGISADKIKAGELRAQNNASWLNLDTGKFNFANGKIAWDGSTFSLSADTIKLGTADVATTGQVDAVADNLKNLEIIGRNLLPNTKELAGFGWGYSEKYGEFNTVSSKPTSGYIDTYSPQSPVLEGLEHTISFFAKAETDMTMVCHFYSPNTTTKAVSSTGQVTNAPDGGVGVSVTTEWKRYWVTWTQYQDGDRKAIIVGRNTTNSRLVLAGFKFEKGNKATEWSPAPEDLVSNNSIMQSIKNSPETVRMTGARMYFDNDVVFDSAFFTKLFAESAMITNLESVKIKAGQIVVGEGAVFEGNLITGKSLSGGDGEVTIATDGNKKVNSNWYGFGGGNQSATSGNEGSYTQVDLGSIYRVAQSKIYFFIGDVRVYYYKIKYSIDGVNWDYAVGNNSPSGWSISLKPVSAGNPSILATVDNFPIPISARYIRIYGNGNSVNSGNHIYEWELFSSTQTIINGGEIETNSITASEIKAGTITSDEISSAGIRADYIKAGRLSATNGASWIDLDNGQFSYGNGKISYNGSSLSLNVDSLKITNKDVATQTQLIESIQNLTIGGRNIFKNSGNFTTSTNYWHDNGGGLALDPTVKYLGFNSIRTTVGIGIVGEWYKLETNVEYTYSLMVKSNNVWVGTDNLPLHYWAGINNVHTNSIHVTSHDTGYTASDVGKWKKVWLTFKLIENADSFKPFIYFGSGTTVMNIGYFKLEKGNKATDWSPAPEDYTETIDAIEVGATNLWVNSETVSAYNLSSINFEPSTDSHQVMKNLIDVRPNENLLYQVWNPNRTVNSYNMNRVSFFNGSNVFLSNIEIPTLNGDEYQTQLMTVPSDAYKARLGTIQGGDQGVKDQAIKIKFEKGNKATGYTPAPKDVENAYTNIAQAKASLAETNAKAHADGKISNEEARAIADAQAKLAAAQGYADNAVGELQVGGRNYFSKSTKISELVKNSSFSPRSADTPNGFMVTGNSSGNGVLRCERVITENGWWTLSFDIKGSQSASVNMNIDICDQNSTYILTNNTNTYKRVSLSVNVNNYTKDVYNFVDFENIGYAYFWVDNIKVEKGQKATDYTPAPEDIESAIDVAQNDAFNAKEKTDNWTVAGTTEINGAKIRTGTLTADKITTGTLKSINIESVNLSSSTIESPTAYEDLGNGWSTSGNVVMNEEGLFITERFYSQEIRNESGYTTMTNSGFGSRYEYDTGVITKELGIDDRGIFHYDGTSGVYIDGKGLHITTFTAGRDTGYKLLSFKSDIDGKGMDVDGSVSASEYLSQIIPSNANLNNYKKTGFYYCPTSASATTVVNTPTNMSFSLLVEQHAGNKQTFTEYKDNNPKTFIRNHYNGYWGKWDLVAYDSGWINMPLASGFTGSLQARQVANTVHLRGKFSGKTSAGGNISICVLPANVARPGANLDFEAATALGGTSGWNVDSAGVYLRASDGQLMLGRAISSSTSYDIGSMSYGIG